MHEIKYLQGAKSLWNHIYMFYGKYRNNCVWNDGFFPTKDIDVYLLDIYKYIL